MTSKLKCPFCKEEAISDVCCMFDEKTRDYIKGKQIYKCNKCSLFGNKELWQALIQAKQDLKKSEKCCSAWETQALDYKAETIALSGKLGITRKALEELWQATHYDTDGYLGKTIQRALEQTEHKE